MSVTIEVDMIKCRNNNFLTQQFKGFNSMKQALVVISLIAVGAVIGSLTSENLNGAAIAQFAPPAQSGDSLWHLPKFGAEGWFLHASGGQVRACNMDKASVVGERTAPRCSAWE
jgi:hypothetical protein